MTIDDGQIAGLARGRLTQAERRAGLRRLGLVTLGLVATALLFAGAFALAGAPARSALAAGSGLVGVFLVIAGVAVFTRTSPVRRTRGSFSMAPAESRRDAERLALGLFAYGIAFSLLGMALG